MPLTRLVLSNFRNYPELRLDPALGFVCPSGDHGAGKTKWLSVLWLTPTMDRLFAGIAGDRHRFFDRLALAGACRMAESARHLAEEVFGPRQVRQWVLSFPYPSRFLFASRPEAIGPLWGIVTRGIAGWRADQSGIERAIAHRVCRHVARKGWLEGEGEFLSDRTGCDDGLDALPPKSQRPRSACLAERCPHALADYAGPRHRGAVAEELDVHRLITPFGKVGSPDAYEGPNSRRIQPVVLNDQHMQTFARDGKPIVLPKYRAGEQNLPSTAQRR